jgi:hypothetical protein
MKRFLLPAILLVLSIGAFGCDADESNTDTAAMNSRPPAVVNTAIHCPGVIVNGMCQYTPDTTKK